MCRFLALPTQLDPDAVMSSSSLPWCLELEQAGPLLTAAWEIFLPHRFCSFGP